MEVGAAVQPCRILLVAGSRYQMAAMKRYLAGIPHHLDFECDSAPALALFRLKRYDVVFLDGRNGGMAPVETAKLMRASERERNLPRTPLVRLASRTEPPGEGDREFDEWLVKPVSRPGLLRAVQRYGLAAWNGGAPLPPAVAGLAGDFSEKGRRRLGGSPRRGSRRGLRSRARLRGGPGGRRVQSGLPGIGDARTQAAAGQPAPRLAEDRPPPGRNRAMPGRGAAMSLPARPF